MDWNDKVKLVELGNKISENESKNEFENYVIKNIETFDAQAWDMFINLQTLIPDDMKRNKDFHKKVYPKVNEFMGNESNLSGMSLRGSIRLDLYEEICKNDLELKLS